MKKLGFLITTLIVSLMLSACSSDYIEISEDESNAIAQYCAHLLLKNDKNKVAERKLLDIDELEDYYMELHKDDPTPTPTPVEEDVTPTPTDEPEETPTPKEPEKKPTESQPPAAPVIGKDGKAKDGSMPYDLVRKQLEFLK